EASSVSGPRRDNRSKSRKGEQAPERDKALSKRNAEPAVTPSRAPVPAEGKDSQKPADTRRPVPATVVSPVASNRRAGRSKATINGISRLFVLDTNVLLHDPISLFQFEEHDIFLPMIVLEELDGHKKGMTEVARNG